MPLLFASVLFLNALLLFWVQPLFAKMVLPLLGGSPSVWTTCMLFFQAALLAGYAYGHAALRALGLRRHAMVHAVIVWVPVLLLPIAVTPTAGDPATRHPISWLLQIMTTSVGMPFVVLATTAPLVQRWFSVVGGRASDPYWLYAASNAGSLAALLAFPTLFEPLIPLGRQTALWKISYIIVAALLTTCALVVIRRRPVAAPSSDESRETSEPAARPTTRTRLRWLALSFAPSSLMLGVTTYLSTDVAAVPLLWVLPLSCYLLTFIAAFGWYSETTRAACTRMLPWLLLPLVLFVLTDLPMPLWITIPIHIGAFSVLALLCHGELARRRPQVRYLTEFYLWLAAGGVLGGVFNTLIAPLIFTSVAEYPIAIGMACVLCVSRDQLRQTWAEPRRLITPALATGIAAALLIGEGLTIVPKLPSVAMIVGFPMVMCLSVAKDSARFALTVVGLLAALIVGNLIAPTGGGGGQVVYAERTFYGVYRVRSDPSGGFVSLVHGTTIHGRQVVGQSAPEPLTYYHRQSPIGQVFAVRGGTAHSVGVIGLGAGTLAAYAQPGASWVFYEIDGAVERVARDTRFFHYLDRCGSQCSVVLGDARLSLARSDAVYDVLVLDAFSSDAIPVHLLTTDALRTYESRLTSDGLLAVHISNRHIGLRPVIARLARDRGLIALARYDPMSDTDRGYMASEWVVMGRNAAAVEPFTSDGRWTVLKPDGRTAWSDEFSNIWTELR